jgi:stage IV sporulation protein FB
LMAIKITFWINWTLVLVNLIPAFPLDGGRILRAILWHWGDYRTSVQFVSWTARIIALVLCVAAWIKWSHASLSGDPTWVALTLLAMVLLFSAKHEWARVDEQDFDDDLLHYDYAHSYGERSEESPHRSSTGLLRRWLNGRRQAREEKRKVLEQEEERRVDEILTRLHEIGIHALSPKDRALLERVSARYRNRQQS